LEPQVIEEVVRSGLARYEYRHFIIFGAASAFAALATECAGDQGAWWEFHDEYLLQGMARTFTRAGAIELAQREELDVARFTQCIDNEEHAERILQMQQQGIADGVNGTPSFRINGQPGGRTLEAILNQVRAAADATEDQEGG